MKISLITVTYNSGTTLRDTIQSVLAQTYRNVEYIVVDGLSKDNTIDIVREYEPQFEGRMKWISEKDKGLYDAMNKGVRMATGDVVGILNSDDFFTANDVLEKVAAGFDEQTDAVYGDLHYVHPDDLQHSVRYYSSKIFKRNLMRMGFIPAHPTFYCRRECFDKFGYYKTDYKIAADFDLLLRFIYVNRIRIKYLPMDMVTMRTGGASTNGLKSRMGGMNEHLRSLRENGVKSNRFILSLRYFYKITEYFRK
ncbi:glycosyltransferase family 2 protein [Bacteroides ndongoniae]|uniref:glycosyltransferase family 2 protein n=1 Tax=Bacteroides ndongoniae TaxID=1903262 RepID=UPI0008DA2708|nr:glycosyltransferase family 2 protein [Bacteroides ndongoniae]